MNMLRLQVQIMESQSGQRLDYALAKLLPKYSRSLIKKWILNKSVKINNIIIDKPKLKIKGNEIVFIHTKINENFSYKPEYIPLNIIYEDKEIIILNKPMNLVVHPGAGNHSGTLLNGLLYHYPDIINVPRAGIVNRLDKNTTGIMIIAKTKFSHTFLINSFKLGTIIREYEAIVNGNISSFGTINQPIGRHSKKRTCMTVNKLGKPAITHYKIIENYYTHSRIRIKLQSGRTHQIRVHMAYIKHPILGDPTYGYSILNNITGISKINLSLLNNFNRQALHAIKLSIIHPISRKIMKWTTKLPDDIKLIINILRQNNNTKFNI